MSARQHRVREIDFRRPSKFARDQIRRLQNAHEGFCRTASSRLSAELRTGFQLDVIGTDQLPYSTVMAEEVPPQALVTVLKVDPLETEVALIMEMQLALCLVDRLLGGGGDPRPASSGLTELEVAVARRALTSMVESLSATWADLADIGFAIASTSTLPMSVQIVPPSEPSLLLNLSAQIDGQLSIITLVLPHRSVEPVMYRLEHSYFGPTEEDEGATVAVQQAVRGVEVELRAEVASVELPLDDVARLRPGDVVRLRRPASSGVVLLAEDVPTYVADPGRNGSARAVQVRERFRPL